MTAKLKNLWISERVGTGEKTIRADFDNDRHYEVVIQHPTGAMQVAYALDNMAHMIAHDPNLTPNGELNGDLPKDTTEQTDSSSAPT